MKYLIVMILALFTAQAQNKIEIFDAQGNKIKEIINNEKSNTNIINQSELILHDQKIKIQKLEKENKNLKEKIKNLENQIAKLNSDIKIKDIRLNIQDTAKETNKSLGTSLAFLTIAQYFFMGIVVLSIIGWIISMFKKRN